MLNENGNNRLGETMDLKLFLTKVIAKWWVILLSCIAGGMLGYAGYHFQKPVYVATSSMVIEPSFLVSGAFPNVIFQNHAIEEKVANAIGPDVLASGTIEVVSIPTDRSALYFTSTSNDPTIAQKIVNQWADSSVEWYKQNISEMQLQLEINKNNADDADKALLNYLYANGLQYLTWCDLTELTGSGVCSSAITTQFSEKISDISLEQRSTLTKLMRDKTNAELTYNTLFRSINDKLTDTDHRVFVSTYAKSAKITNSNIKLLIIPLGVFMGFFLAVLGLLILDWWKAPSAAECNAS